MNLEGTQFNPLQVHYHSVCKASSKKLKCNYNIIIAIVIVTTLWKALIFKKLLMMNFCILAKGKVTCNIHKRE